MKLRFLLTIVIASFCFFSFGQTKSLYFVNGATQNFSVCENSTGFDFSTYLTTYEATIGSFLSYTPVSETQNGSFTNIPITKKTGTNVYTPSNTLYTPPANFSGTDVLVIQVSDGTNTATVKLTITINKLPTVAAITGNTISCGSGTNTLSDNTNGGVWSSDNTVVATVDSMLGIVTPVSAGTANIGYTVTDNTTGCSNTAIITFISSTPPVVNNIGLATGSTANACVASTTIFTDATPAPTGGSYYWKSSNTARATVDSFSGVITGISAGNSTISYVVTNTYGCTANKTRNVTITASPVVDTIAYSTRQVCVGSAITLTDATPFSRNNTTWTTSNANATATVTGFFPYTASVVGVTAGTDSIYFNVTSGGCTATAALLITVNPVPQVEAISGPTSICQYNTAQLYDATAKGVWSSSRPAIATISTTGLLNALTAGRTTITYTVTSAGCSANTTILDTVNAGAVVAPISGTNSLCIGSSAQLADNTVGGVWSISNNKVATIDNTGLLTGKSTGNDTVYYTYTTSGGCTQIASFPVSVAASVVVAPISGASSICLNNTTQLTDASVDPSATWSSSDNSIAVVDNSGNITTIQAGVVTIQYTIGSGSCSGSALKNFIVYGLPNIDVNSVQNTSMCTGNTLKLTNDSVGGVWSAAGSSASVDSSGFVIAVSAGSSQIFYSITDKHGCYNSAATQIAVNAAPAAFTLSGSTSTCKNGVITYTTSIPVSETGIWATSNDNVAHLINTTNALSKSVLAKGLGTASIYCTVNNGQCTRTDTLVLTVSKALVMTPIIGLDNICMGSTPTYVDSTSNGSITWSITSGTGSASISGAANASTVVITPVTTGTIIVNYAVNEGIGCTGSVKDTVVINPLPTVATITGSTNNVCAGATITLADATTGGIWKSSNTTFATVDSFTGVVTGINGTRGGFGGGNAVNITYTYTSPAGCTSNAPAAYRVTVNASPTRGTTRTVTSLCEGNTATFTYTPPNGSTTTGTWSSFNTNVATIDANSGLVVAISPGTTVIQYTIPSAFGCPGVINNNFTVAALPKVVATKGDSVLCVGQNTQLYNTSVIPNNGSAVWSSSDPTVITINSTGLVTAIGSGTASIYYTVTNPRVGVSTCSSIATTNFTVNANPVVPNIAGSGSTLCVGNTLVLSDATIGGIWGVNDTSIASISLTTGLVTGISGGNIIFTYTVDNGTTGCNTTVFGNGTIISLPVIAPIAGNSITCVGQPSQLTDATTQGVWTSSTLGVATINSKGLLTPIASGTSVISYTYTNPTYGCVNSSVDTVTVNPVPVVGVVTGNSSTCNGSPLTVADTSVTGNWSSSNLNIATINNAGIVMPVAPGKDTIAYTVTFPITNCSTKQILPITVNASPVASFTVNKSSQCLSGNYFVFTNTSTISAGSKSYVWTISGNTFTSTSPTYSFASAGTYIIKLVVTSTLGCTDSTTQTVTVSPQSNPSFTVNTASQCLTGNSFSLTNNSTISSGFDTYSWNFGDGTSSSSTSPTHTYTKANTFTIQLNAISDNGCLDSITQTVTTIANVTPSVVVKASSTSICTGANVVFTAIGTNGGATPDYQWYKNGINVGSGVTYNDNGLSNNDAVHCVLTTSAPCYTVQTAQSNKIVIAVAAYVLPSVSISTPTNNICAGTSVTFIATPTNGGSTPAYQWMVNSKNIAIGLTYTSSTFADKDVVTCMLTSSVNCVLARSVNSNPITLTVKSATTSTTNYSICAGDSYTFNSSSYDSAGTYTTHLKNAAGCDSAATLILAVKYPTTSVTNASVCLGNSYLFNGTLYNTAGRYPFRLVNSVGCDSLAVLVLTVNNPSTSSTSITACISYTWNGSTYTKSGTYTFLTKNAVGCDSTATLLLTVNYPSVSFTSITACSSYTWNGITYTKSGTYIYLTKNAVDCDSTASLVLTINYPSTSSTSITACSSYVWNGISYTKSGTYTYLTKNAVGCDSTASLVLTINYPSTSFVRITACSSYTWNGTTYTMGGTYTYLTKNAVGCDSTATLVLTVNQPSVSSTSIVACNSYMWNGTTYTTGGIYTYLTKNAVGCDSTATLILTVNYPSTSSTSITACSSYAWNGITYTKSGTYTYLTKNAVGCDSTASLVLTINYPSTSSTSIIACSSYVWNGITYTKSGTYTYLTKNAVGCDSTATLLLTVNYPSTSSTSITACSSYKWNGTTYVRSGVYTYLTKNVGGCDSTATLVLTINQPSTSSTSIIACSSYTWNGTTYTKNGTYTFLAKNSFGCDSTASLLLTVNYPSVSSTNITVCSSYTWNSITYITSGVYTYLTKNAAGCDSTATLLLTVNYPSTSSTSITACSSYTWNGTIYTTSGTYTYITKNAVGCDSTATLSLTVNYPSISSTSMTACSSYTWNGIIYTKSGTYIYLTKNTVGCDSTATLLLTVNYPSTSSTSMTACSSYVWNGITYTKSGTYTYLTKNAVGCDSTAKLVLTVNYPLSSITKASICAGSIYSFNGKSCDSAGTYVSHLTNAVGCDSAASLILSVRYPTTSTTTASICAGNTYSFNGKTYDSAGTYVSHLTNAVGCDSAVTLILGVRYSTKSITNINLCPNSLPYTWNGLTFTGAGTQTAHLINVVGCDSAATLVVKVNQPSTSVTKLTICSDVLPYSWNGLTFTGAGSLTAHLNNAVGCDSAATLVLTVNPITISITNMSICSSALPYTWNGLTFTVAGTQTAHLMNSTGCDSAATLVLSLKATSASTTTASICAGASYTFNGITYDSTGTYVTRLTNSVGCDSVATLVLTVKYPSASTITASLCAGNGYNFNGTVYDSAGTYVSHLTNAAGCDSVAMLVLSVKYPSSSITTASIDSGNTYTFNGVVYNTPGTYISHLANSVSCDSVAKLILTVVNPTSSTTIASICAGSSYIYSGTTYDSAGTYVNHFKNAGGADSTATLILTVNSPTFSTTTASICAGVGYTFNGTSYDSAGTYTTHLANSMGCDSVAILVLTVKYPSASITAASICVGGSYAFNGTSYTKAGTYNVHFTNAAACDSTATLVLTVNNPSASTTNASICAGGTYLFNGTSYDSAGTYTSHLNSSVGCDSVATLVLTVNYPSVSTTTASICAGSSYYFNGLVYDTTGIYVSHLTNVAGCDSTATLVLTVKYPSELITNASICSGNSYLFNGTAYDSAGVYKSHFVNAVGCDSLAKLVLTINYPTTTTTTASICAGSSYTFNGTAYDSTGTYVSHLTGAAGCDSIATLVLTVKYSSSSIITASICAGGSYTFNGTSYDSTGTYVSHVSNAAGCDSITTLVLTIKYSSSSITTASICAGFSYSFNGTAYDSAGTYKVHFTNAAACDSIATLVLNVNSATTSTTLGSINAGGSYTFNGVVYDSAGTYTAHLTNANGCDSVAILVLTSTVPVTLKSFSGVYQSGTTALSWSTATELNTSHYVVQRSTNGIDFATVKSVSALNKLSGATYAYSDLVNTTGKLYYRLQVVDKNGASTYSKTIVVTIDAGYSFSLYPNPVRSTLTLHLDNNKAENVTLQVVSMLGKVVHQQQVHLNVGTTDISLDVANYAQGSYIVVIKGDTVQQKQFIKL